MRELALYTACHGPGPGPRNPAYPELAGQYAGYLVLQLELFKEEHRGGSAYAHLMHEVAPRLTGGDAGRGAVLPSLGSGPAP